MKEPIRSSLLYDESQSTSTKIDKSRNNGSRYSFRFIILIGITGLLCLIAAIVLTIIGVVGLRNYGFANSPLIAGIVLFGTGGVLTIAACIACGLK